MAGNDGSMVRHCCPPASTPASAATAARARSGPTTWHCGIRHRPPAAPARPARLPQARSGPQLGRHELPELTGNGKPLPFHRQADTPVAAATGRASLGSFLFTAPVASSHTRALSLGGTSSTRSPRRQQVLGQQMPEPTGPLHCPCPLRAGRRQASRRCAWAAEARTRSWPSGSPAALIATAVRISPDHHCRHRIALLLGAGEDRGGHA
jgi:hypothetical protein